MVETSKKYFRNLPKIRQDKLRREYRSKHFKEYSYSIRLFILQILLGILSLSGLIIMFFRPMSGLLIFTTSFIFLLIGYYFLELSNYAFYKFIHNKRNYLE